MAESGGIEPLASRPPWLSTPVAIQLAALSRYSQQVIPTGLPDVGGWGIPVGLAGRSSKPRLNFILVNLIAHIARLVRLISAHHSPFRHWRKAGDSNSTPEGRTP